MITDEEAILLTEKPTFRADVGKTYVLVLANWRYELRDNVFENKNEKRHTFVATVISINDEMPRVKKEFFTSNNQLLVMLVPICQRAQRYNKATVTIELTRLDNRRYQVVDVGYIRSSLSSVPNSPTLDFVEPKAGDVTNSPNGNA